jgi:hypothetical protein
LLRPDEKETTAQKQEMISREGLTIRVKAALSPADRKTWNQKMKRKGSTAQRRLHPVTVIQKREKAPTTNG